MSSTVLDRLSARHAGLLGLCLLSLAYMALFRYDLYGVEEAAARALLLNWSIVHQVASPVGLFGVPDLRGFLFVLLDLHWAGSLIAAKVFSMLILFATVLALYRWSERYIGAEAGMIACGLLPLLPISIMQADAVGGGIYLLAAFVAIAWLDPKVRASTFDMPGLAFLEAVLLAFSVSIHPAGLAVAVVLGFMWWRDPAVGAKKRRNVLIVLSIGLLVPLLIRMGWPDAAAMPEDALSFFGGMLLGPSLLPVAEETRQGVGLILAVLLVLVMAWTLWRRGREPLTWFLLLGLLFGAWHMNDVWLFLAAAFLLYVGTPLLLQAHARLGWPGLWGQRGGVLLLLFLVATTAMSVDRMYRSIGQQHLMDASDRLIAVLAADAQQRERKFLAVSEWPARTMMACRRDVLPLSVIRRDDDAQAFLQGVEGVTHFLFDPRAERNRDLARVFSALSSYYETVALEEAGVVLKRRDLPRQDG